MKRPKTRVLIESVADATQAARALLALLRSIDEEAFVPLLAEQESLAGVPADNRLRDDLLARIEQAIGRALPAGYYLSYEKVRSAATSGYVLRREGEEELDSEGGPDTLSTGRRTPRDVTRTIERNATNLGPVHEPRHRSASEDWTLSAESHHALSKSQPKEFRGGAADRHLAKPPPYQLHLTLRNLVVPPPLSLPHRPHRAPLLAIARSQHRSRPHPHHCHRRDLLKELRNHPDTMFERRFFPGAHLGMKSSMIPATCGSSGISSISAGLSRDFVSFPYRFETSSMEDRIAFPRTCAAISFHSAGGICRGDSDRVPPERLIRMLTRLGRDVEINIRPSGKPRAGRVRVVVGRAKRGR